MEFAEMAWGILFMFPPHPVTLLAKATLVKRAHFRDEPIVRLVRLKTTREAHLVDLLAFKDTEKRLCSDAVLESRDDPINCKGISCNPPAGFFESEGIGLE